LPFRKGIGRQKTLRASELEGKEVININTGDRLGFIRKTELLVNTVTGIVDALIIVKIGIGGREKEIMTIPWRKIKKIGAELIIVDYDA
jgi:YlmC/YmxH family sporulation protein